MTLPSTRARRQWLAIAAILTALVGLFVAMRVNPVAFITEFHYVRDLAAEMWPPRVDLLWTQPRLWNRSIAETMAMATLGTLIGCSIAFGAALLAARNTTVHPWVRLLLRVAMATERAITAFFFLMVFLIAFGLGPFAGTLTLIVAAFGTFGRLFADALEQADPLPCEAIEAVGATRLQVIAFGVMPQAAPALLATAFYAFDINLRASIALGVFGAGGLGFAVNIANNFLRYDEVLAYALISMALVTAAEFVADVPRRRIFKLSNR